MNRLGLARQPGEALFSAVAEAGWQPLTRCFTVFEPTDDPCPCGTPDLAIVLSPAAARAADLPAGLPCLATGQATADALTDHPVELAASPDAEGIWHTLQERLPHGGNILLVRGERSRGFLEQVAEGSPWRLHPWITHREAAASPFPPLDDLDAVLALSPFQAELLATRCKDLHRLAWGHRTAEAFARCGAPAHGWCEPRPAALKQLLTRMAP